VILPTGAIAIREWRDAAWGGFGELLIHASPERAGTLVLRLTETDQGLPEGYTVHREIEEGDQVITVRLAAEPEGDLIPSTVAPVNGAWDPETGSTVTLGFIAVPGEMEIYSIELRKAAESTVEEKGR
jgi:hypothetical protein